MNKLIKLRSFTIFGYTLVELLVVIAIISIVASIGYPSYISAQRENRRVDGHIALINVKLQIEQFIAEHSEYSCADWSSIDPTVDIKYKTSSKSQFYTLSITNFSACPFTYTITATGQGSQTKDTGCEIITLDSLTSKQPAECW